jgi:hypothetical protein
MQMIPLGQWPFLIGVLIFVSAGLTAIWRIGVIVKRISDPLREIFAEHNVLWEDYNIRTGGSYRRLTGRGRPPDPEEFYRAHPIEREL